MLKALGSIPSTAEKNSVLLCPGSFPAEVTVAQLCLSSRHPRSKHKCVSVCDENIHTPSHSFFHFYKAWNHMEHGTYTMFAVLMIIVIFLWLCLRHLLPSVHQWTSGFSCTWTLPYMSGTQCAITACMGTRASIEKYQKPGCCSGLASEKLPSALWWPLGRLLGSAWHVFPDLALLPQVPGRGGLHRYHLGHAVQASAFPSGPFSGTQWGH